MIRILVVDDQNILRQGVKLLLDSREKIEVVGTAEDGENAIKQVETLNPDIVLIDIEMPGIDGITATHRICQKFPKTKVIVLSSHENQEYVGKALQAGAEGYLLKSTLIESLEQAILSVYEGQSQIESRLLKKAIAELSSPSFTSKAQQAKNKIIPNKFVKSEAIKDKKMAQDSLGIGSDVGNIRQLDSNENTPRQNGKSQSNKNSLNNIVFKEQKNKTKKLNLENTGSKRVSFPISNRSWADSKLAIALFLLTIVAASTYVYYSDLGLVSSPVKQQKPNIIPVKTTLIEPVTSYSTSQTYTGEVTALRTSEIGFERTGKLIRVFVEEGEFVAADAPLAELDTANIKAQRVGLVAQKAQAQAILAELKNGARSEQIAAAQANVGDVQQQLELENFKSDRREYLYKEGAISREQLDEIHFNRKALQKRLANAQSSLNELKSGTRVEQVDAQQSAVAQIEAEIADLDIVISKSILRSPFNGVVSARNLDEGTVVEAGRSIIRLVENIQPKVKIGVPIAVAEKIQSGEEQRVTIAGKDYKAIVDFILPEVDVATRTRTVVLKLPLSATNRVSPKQIARLNIVQTEDVYGYWLPITALVKSDRGLWSCYASVDSADGKNKQTERRYVEILESQEDRVLVRGTIKSEDEIIVKGTHRLVPGQLVKPLHN